ncbi:hypothetical protein CLV98_11135 [Dyadobacter jejuensis]|uniref:Heparinase II/III-like protein n=1 Tax=Dyadobacter jejuensis TaxID=1082580 RepID=A0A316AFZ8_9BACT|nr:hypothetical protein CLV98_11135 [Dyadobacter jejuensis]
MTRLAILFTFIYVSIIGSGCHRASNSGLTIYPSRPGTEIKVEEDQLYWELVNGENNIDWRRLDGTLEYIKKEYDCSDFRMVNLIRILYEFENDIPLHYKTKIEDVLFHFRYWLDEPGENSMCYWSENHQILFASAEYLIGQKYPTSIFPNSGLTGRDHMLKAQKRILEWLSMRWNYGFTEFYSNVYYKEDIGALINLIDYAADEEITSKSKIILDLLFYDIAAQSSKTMFISASGRAYERNRKGGKEANLSGVTQYYWGNGEKLDAGMMYGLMVSKKYELPPIFKEIARDSSNLVIKQSNGLDIAELKSEGYFGTDTRSLMMQWGMEAFVNPKIVRNSLAHIRSYRMFSNAFTADFKKLDNPLLRFFHLEPLAVNILKPQQIGTAIQKGNTYTYKTNDYSMYTVQSYDVGNYADQHHVFGMNIKDEFAIFHCHPYLEKDVKFQSPNYWVGYGHLPHSVQYKHVNLSIYRIPAKKGMMEKDLLNYTHAYFPKEKFDSTIVEDRYIFGKKGDSYCAMIGANDLIFREGDAEDLIQQGKRVYWVTEAGSKSEDGPFEEFVNRIKTNKIQFNERKLTLTYQSQGHVYDLKYDDALKVDGALLNTAYKRFDSPYIQAEKKAKTFEFNFNGKTLFHDFENNVRTY